MKLIPYINLVSQWADEREELLPIIDRVLASGQYIGGQYVEEFEEKAARLCQTKYCVALNSGTDALLFGLAALGIGRGDEVITPPNSFIASMDAIKRIADRHGIPIIEDAAQAIGSKYRGLPSGKWGTVGCFSTHPLKNLNACGDGGFLVTDDENIASQIKILRSHGLIDRNTASKFGNVSRMDALQAAILNFRIDRLEDVTSRRRKNADLYHDLLNPMKVFVPANQPLEFNSFHTFVVQISHRDKVQGMLRTSGIETSVHYPIPIHLQPAASKLGYRVGDFPSAEDQAKNILTLPIHQYLTRDEVTEIATKVNLYCE